MWYMGQLSPLEHLFTDRGLGTGELGDFVSGASHACSQSNHFIAILMESTEWEGRH